MAFSGPAAPSREPLTDKAGLCRLPWLTWFRNVRASLDAAPTQVTGGKVQLTAKTATIGTTPVPTSSLVAGLYRLAYYIAVTTAAGVASDFTVTITWTSGTVTKTWTGVLKNGNTTATYEASGPPLMHVDAGTPVSYAVLYNSNPAAAMQFEFNLQLELVSAD